MSEIEIAEKLKSIERRIQGLRKEVVYCTANYTGNHPNNEIEVLKEKFKILKDAEVEAEAVLNAYEKLSKLIDNADDLCNKVEKTLLQRGMNDEVAAVNESLKNHQFYIEEDSTFLD